jgi:YidC/Oxa1 family membrane protein insertase
MGKRFLTIALWGLVAVFIMRTCFPSGQGPEEVDAASRWMEDFDQPQAADYPLVLENELVRTEWSATGASCGRVILKKFSPALDEEGQELEGGLLLYDATWVEAKEPGGGPATGSNYRRREAFRLLEGGDFLFPPDTERGVKSNLDGVVWKHELDAAAGSLRFTWTSPQGVTLVKELRLEPGAYHLDARVRATADEEVDLPRALEMNLGTGGGLRITADQFYPNPYVGAADRQYGELESVDFYLADGDWSANRGAVERWNSNNIPFIVEGSKYFLSIIGVEGERGFQGAVAEKLFDDLAASEALAEEGRGGAPARLSSRSPFWKRSSVAGNFELQLTKPGTPDELAFTWYVGPKDPRILTASAYGDMSEVVHYADYGRSFFYRIFLTQHIAPVILWVMALFHGITGNWGIAIILLTVVVRAAVFPIMRHSQVKMAVYQAKMSKVKPQLDAINKKYKDDPQKKNQETMKLYQQHKLSPPLGGCLPIFLQMPIFVGLFQALRSSILLRHESFALWIGDLAEPDALIDFGGPILGFFPFSGVTSLNLLPILMVVLWIIHQRSMPKPTDPQQAQMYKMMAFMPVIFGFVLYNYASGLSLYMITSSAIGIFEQRVIRKRWPVPGAPQPGGAEGGDK